MQLVQLFVQIEAAHDTVDELGQLGVIQFRDLNPNVNAFHRNFVNDVKRCDEMERKVRFFEDQVVKEKGLNKILNSISIENASSNSASLNVDELEVRFDELEKELITLNGNQQMLDRNLNELQELQHVLSADSVFFAQSRPQGLQDTDMRSPLLAPEAMMESGGGGGAKAVKLGYITGVINRTKVSSFERVLWRATRGNLFMRQSDIGEAIKDPQTGEMLEKNVFIIFFQGDRLQVKIKKICESFGATLYPCPETDNERRELLQQVQGRLSDLEVVLARSHEHRKQVLSGVASHLQTWKAKVLKEKAIYHTMNMFNYDLGRKCLIAEGWCPQTATDDVQLALRRATQRSNALVPSILSVVHSDEVPPTHFTTSKYTYAYQEIVNAYGMAHYREVNPAVLTLVTFPFLFGIMFGDVGHGFFLLVFSFLLIRYENVLGSKKLNEIVQMPFDGRYVLVVMSMYAIYCGFIYNEFFSIPMSIFSTAWQVEQNATSPFNWTDPGLSQATYQPIAGQVYPFGVDPVWKGCPNELDYYNSFKMKLSILLGILQMSLGIFLSAMNYNKEKAPLRWINLLFQFLPQITFLWSIFGYMCVLVIIKWVTAWDAAGNPPPSILPIIINMFLSPGASPPEPLFFNGQHGVQLVLTFIAILCIPIMLLVKPLLLRHYHKQSMHHHRLDEDHEEPEPHGNAVVHHEGGGGGGHGGHGEEFEFAEVMIHQIIHTIEFVLGAISNTASYLRLWALSLAHSELSTVFWNRVLIGQLQSGSAITVFAGWAVWAGATFAVLLIMETLSAFLHALRLHWVEFQNKFYVGDGIRFTPFSYKKILQGDTDE
jgi:V-type H+-transporting ATPase subunit a